MIKTLLENKFFILILMIFLHIFEDFHLQGILASMKQISWWEKELGSEYLGKYSNDWAIALLAHAFEWAFIIMLPIFCLKGFTVEIALFLLFNVTGHGAIDIYKCNLKTINLVQDQLIHIGQIIFTWFFSMFVL